MATKTKYRIKVGLRLLSSKNSEGILPVDLEGEDCEITEVSKEKITLQFLNADKTIWSFDLTEGDEEDFRSIFSEMEEQSFQYDFKSIWIAPDGGGAFYSYNSEESANDYCNRTDEDGPYPVARSGFDTYGPEMFIILREMLKRLNAGQDVAGFKAQIAAVVDRVSDEEKTHLAEILRLNEDFQGRGPSKK